MDRNVFPHLSEGRKPVCIDESNVLTLASTALGKMSKEAISRWLAINKIQPWHLIFWSLNRLMPGLEICFRNQETMAEVKTRGLRVGTRHPYPLCPQGHKTIVNAKRYAGVITPEHVHTILEKIKEHGDVLFHSSHSNHLKILCVLHRDLQRHLVAGFNITYVGQPLACHLCSKDHTSKHCPTRCRCGDNPPHLPDTCNSQQNLNDDCYGENSDDDMNDTVHLTTTP